MTFELPPEPMREKYKNRRREDLKKARAALADKDFEFLKNLGHQIKGNAETFGFPELTNVGKTLELAAKEHSVEKVNYQIQALENWLRKFFTTL